MTPRELVAAATAAMAQAYAPYSRCTVGAALLAEDGRVFTGCNVENAGFTATSCAERTAFFKAVSEGCRRFAAMAVVGSRDGVIGGEFPPCGVCRQVMREFCSDEFPVYLGGADGTCRTVTLGQLLPDSFGPEFVKN